MNAALQRLAKPALRPAERRRYGRYFTPPELVDFAYRLSEFHLPGAGELAIVDPACGDGAFLRRAHHFFPRALLFGLEIAPALAAACRCAVPRARVLVGDALRGGAAALLREVPRDSTELWIANPPYNGTSPLLHDKRAYRRARALLPETYALPKGTSLRDDFAFFLLFAARRLSSKAGALAFVTSATLLDAFLYAPLRAYLLQSLALREVVELGTNVFEETKVATCLTVWTSDRRRGRTRFWCRAPMKSSFAAADLRRTARPIPRPPEYLLRPPRSSAEALDRSWRAQGEEIHQLVPVNFPGLKTRFDELLVDDNPALLLRRLGEFVRTPVEKLPRFAERHRIPPRCLDKLRDLRVSCEGLSIDESRVRPFLRYRGFRHREGIPKSSAAFCYLDRRLIPRGDHRLRGDYDPHAYPVKLVYNTHELPISAVVVEQPACIHDHRHARFAPLFAPAMLVSRGLGESRAGHPLGPPVANLSAAGLALGERVGGPIAVFRMIAQFINSPEVQQIWAPAYATTRSLPVPVNRWREPLG